MAKRSRPLCFASCSTVIVFACQRKKVNNESIYPHNQHAIEQYIVPYSLCQKQRQYSCRDMSSHLGGGSHLQALVQRLLATAKLRPRSSTTMNKDATIALRRLLTSANTCKSTPQMEKIVRARAGVTSCGRSQLDCPLCSWYCVVTIDTTCRHGN